MLETDNVYLLEYNLLLPFPSSCDGESAPERVLAAIFPAETRGPPGAPKGDLRAPPVKSAGEPTVVDVAERGCSVFGGRRIDVGGSALVDMLCNGKCKTYNANLDSSQITKYLTPNTVEL